MPLLFSKYAAPVLSTRVLVFTTLIATTSAAVAGVLPGWRSARVDVMAILHRGAGTQWDPEVVSLFGTQIQSIAALGAA